MYFLNFHLLYSSTLCLSFISSSSLSNISYFSLPVLPFFFQDLGLSLLSLLWSIFWVICLSPLHLVVFLGFYFVPSSGTYSSSVSFCLTFCVYGVCSAVSVLWFLLFLMSAPSGWVCLRSLYLFPGGRRWCLPTGCWVCQVGRTILRGVSRGGCGLRKTLGSQSAGGWGCVLFVVWVRYPGLGTYGLLGGARSWCQNGRLQNTSHNYNECSLVSLSQVSLFP